MTSQKIVITGGTGLIGRKLSRKLWELGYDIYIISRKHKTDYRYGKIISWRNADIEKAIDGAKAVINLAGQNISTLPWNRKNRHLLMQSRVLTGHILTQVIEKCENKPEIFIQASATGFYGPDLSKPSDENTPAGEGYLAGLCKKWEESTRPMLLMGIRWIAIRSGLVLSWHGGFLRKMVYPFWFFAGGHFGNGKHILPWIHIDDEVAAIIWLIEQNPVYGVVNLVSPNPANMKQFCQTLGKTMHRPSWMHIPSFLLRWFFGSSMTKELLLANQQVVPKKLVASGFVFRFGQLDEAIANIINQEKYETS